MFHVKYKGQLKPLGIFGVRIPVLQKTSFTKIDDKADNNNQ